MDPTKRFPTFLGVFRHERRANTLVEVEVGTVLVRRDAGHRSATLHRRPQAVWPGHRGAVALDVTVDVVKWLTGPTGVRQPVFLDSCAGLPPGVKQASARPVGRFALREVPWR